MYKDWNFAKSNFQKSAAHNWQYFEQNKCQIGWNKLQHIATFKVFFLKLIFYKILILRITKDVNTLIVGLSSKNPGGGIGTVDYTASNVNKPLSYVGGQLTVVGVCYI
jgi:hypothetical protein